MTILLNKILNTFKENIIPLTKKSVESGNKIFGAAILKKEDFSIVMTGANNEIENPLWHGEVHTLKKFYELPKEKRPSEKNCLFISSHEPCSLCLSAITFAGFDNFYYLFPYQSTSDEFNIPHDLNILKEVFNVKEGKYIKKNSYWKSINIISLINELPKEKVKDIMIALNNIKNTYKELSKQYQSNKVNNNIPLK
tara:strand:+ start:792 stop:1379 length:588 start_codon:yes stop_codon:yes gene_type:complete